ncbi:hypothetical protein BD324DRAFT_451328 [Kockovaella imperatae]|uniref:Beta-glucuronidase C-terminal domain-containing protein n=1 Tax=Kockovaella imperatae TaxID=4999 RepID=A0A1Y1UHC1_9TREE|nr:hypothetical protein BD324DRAFT_451328 [Kockovaella imperatae]ORX37451.1 hypothetical protein BD324DRAFT_451328 [Kockovaella imperatae]
MFSMTESPAGPSSRPIHSTISRRRQHARRSRRNTLLSTAVTALSLLPSVAAQASITVYNTVGTVTQATLAPSATYTGLPAYDPTMLTPPDAPQPPVDAVSVNVPGTADAVQAAGMLLSKEQMGNFVGFSIELSVAPSLFGSYSGILKPEFLNYMANIQVRAGMGPIIRVGGNTQDSSTLYTQGFDNGQDIQKTQSTDQYGNAVTTPIVNYSPELLYIMANISSHVDARWYFGLAFNESDVSPPIENIATAAQYISNILSDKLLGLVVGNEPDLYVDHNHREAGYNVTDYMTEFDAVTDLVLQTDSLTLQAPFVGPSVCCQVPGFELQDILNAGYLDAQNSARIGQVTVQHYPENNCQIDGNVEDPQTLFPTYLNHTSPQALVQLYAADVAAVRSAGKEIVMLETNTASCGGFPGLSDSFGAAIWMTDYALQMAYGNFSAALLHSGGQGTYYNPFTPPSGTLPDYYKWTTGSVYYSALVVAEAFGQSNVSQIVDLNMNNGSIYHPGYAIYENGAPSRLVLINYVSDPTGASTYQATVTLGDGVALPSSVAVRYLQAPSVADHDNITWAGQTLGSSFNSDGRLMGNQTTVTIDCENGACVVPVYAPSIALVFLNGDALTNSNPVEGATQTYATTVIGFGSATINPEVLETSNGQNGGQLGSNSKGSAGAADRRAVISSGFLVAFTLASAVFASLS